MVLRVNKIKIALFIFFIISQILPGQPDSDREFWQSLNEQEKVIFLQGIYAGLSKGLDVIGEEAARQKARDPFWTPPFALENSTNRLKEYYSEKIGFDYTTIAKLLDAFYSNPDNAHIDILYALRVLMLYQNGQQRRANELLLLKQKEFLRGR